MMLASYELKLLELKRSKSAGLLVVFQCQSILEQTCQKLILTISKPNRKY